MNRSLSLVMTMTRINAICYICTVCSSLSRIGMLLLYLLLAYCLRSIAQSVAPERQDEDSKGEVTC